MNIDEMTYGQIKEILRTIGNNSTGNIDHVNHTNKRLIGKHVIVRCSNAGVHFGELVDYNGQSVYLKNSRRMWYWEASSGHTLTGCALYGLKSTSKIAGIIPNISLLDACEIIECSTDSAVSIGGIHEHNNK